jgi:protoheme IX farnesyltransferase
LKRLTPLNIVIGGAAGALPPVVGYAAASGAVGLDILSLFAVIFVWTPPHFWALALVKSGDYARAGVPMLPNVKGAARTRTEILVYSLVLAPLGLTPWLTGLGGPLYAVVAAIAGVGMVVMALRVYRIREGAPANRAAMQMFGFSIVYLFTLVALLIAERGMAAIAHRIW